MSIKIVELPPKRYDKEGLLSVIDTLRAEVASGKIVGFGGVGIAADDETYLYTGCVKGQGVSRLKMYGALANLLHRYINDPDD